MNHKRQEKHEMVPSKGNVLVYQAEDDSIKLDVRLEDETVWLTQAHMAELFQVKPQNITMHLRNIYAEGELTEKSTCKEFLQVQQEGTRQVERKRKFYNLDAIIQLNGRELLTHAGRISHQMATERAELEYGKFREHQREIEKEQSLKELEEDIKRLNHRRHGKYGKNNGDAE